MATTKANTSRDVTAELAYLTRALKAPTLRESVARLAERARAENWTHEEYLAACLQREVSARESHGGGGRLPAPRSPPQNQWGSLFSTTPADSNATPSPTSGRWTSSPPATTSSSSAHPGLVNIAPFSYRLCRIVQVGRGLPGYAGLSRVRR